ncbi:MAG: hypothetical protein JWP74_3747 [Marmoricola sp.]|nr:hypothetical protein [Marmoricola sp.]
MATVQIRNLDDDAYDVLKTRAAASGRSLQEYLRVSLEEMARKQSVRDALDRVRADLAGTEDSVTLADIVAIQRAGRDQ